MQLSQGIVKVIVALISAVTSLGVAWISAEKGVVSFPNPTLEKQVAELKQRLDNRSQLTGDFEWQWAGDSWLGSLTFRNLANGDISARTDMRTVTYNYSRTQMRDIVAFRSDVDGSVVLRGGQTILLHLPVEVGLEYMKAHHVNSNHIDLDAELQPVEAFAGRVQYRGDKTTQGDIVLVRYRSDPRRW